MVVILHSSLCLGPFQCDFTILPIKQWSLFPTSVLGPALWLALPKRWARNDSQPVQSLGSPEALHIFHPNSWNSTAAMETSLGQLAGWETHHPITPFDNQPTRSMWVHKAILDQAPPPPIHPTADHRHTRKTSDQPGLTQITELLSYRQTSLWVINGCGFKPLNLGMICKAGATIIHTSLYHPAS